MSSAKIEIQKIRHTAKSDTIYDVSERAADYDSKSHNF